jgi:aminoglycoside phosphotransferase (APT) family kinase protein
MRGSMGSYPSEVRLPEPEPELAARLRDVLESHLEVSAVEYAEVPISLAGGFSNEIFRFRLRDPAPGFEGPLVLRLVHDDADAAREAIVMHGVSEAGYPAPRVLVHGPCDGLGRPFIITPLVSGQTFEKMLRPRTAIRVIRRLPDQLAEMMALLHAVPTDSIAEHLAEVGWSRTRLDSLGVLTEVDAYADELRSSSLLQAGKWLHAHAPEFGIAVVCHGDLHPLNALFEGGRIVAVLDWELARLADPAFDVARSAVLLRMAPYPMNRVTRRLVQPFTRRLADSFVRSYRERCSLNDESLQWHEALHSLRILTLALAGARQSPHSRLHRLADVWLPVAPYLSAHLAKITGVAVAA